MDMITKIEIEDAVRVHGKIEARVRRVAEVVGSIRGDFALEGEDQPTWRMDAFTINNTKVVPGMEHLVELAVRTCWSAFRGEGEEQRRITRIVQFPEWYLLRDGWEDREQRKTRNARRLMARLNLKTMQKSVSDRADDYARMVEKLAEMTKLAAEPYEPIGE